MEIISMILLAIVLVAQIVLFVLYFLEKRYVNHRFSAMLQYVDRKIEDTDYRDETAGYVKDMLDGFSKKFDERFAATDKKISENYSEVLNVCKTAFETQDKRIDERFNLISLDYSEAQQAANKVNDFASSLASIFDYDPIQAIQRGRKKEAR